MGSYCAAHANPGLLGSNHVCYCHSAHLGNECMSNQVIFLGTSVFENYYMWPY